METPFSGRDLIDYPLTLDNLATEGHRYVASVDILVPNDQL